MYSQAEYVTCVTFERPTAHWPPRQAAKLPSYKQAPARQMQNWNSKQPNLQARPTAKRATKSYQLPILQAVFILVIAQHLQIVTHVE